MSTEFPSTAEITADVQRALKAIGVDTDVVAGDVEVRTPITGEVIFRSGATTADDVDAAVAAAAEAFRGLARRCRRRCAASWSSASASC